MVSKNKRGGLGRGMEALFSTAYEESPGENELVTEVELSQIRPNPYQPRKHFDPEALNELAESIRKTGVFQPIIIRRSTIKGYELIAGERRVRASKLAGKTTIPAIIRDLNEEAMIEIAVIENLQREDLSPLEEAEAYAMLMENLRLTQAQVAERIGKSRPYIANYIRLLQLPESVKDLVNQEKLTMGHARTLLGVNDSVQMVKLAKQVIKEHWTVRQLEEKVQSINQQSAKDKSVKTKKVTKSPYIRALENQMEEKFGSKSNIVVKGNRGKIEIEYVSQSDLTRILDILDIHL
ncbi:MULTISPECIES: ParB/RepB/Spo0J family partition protein [Facklamia]|uniref:ParB/RepB/Spo0J family partition protein n=1 Tax=Facklamia hominis TaxID=178214 RepID=A0AAJ1Q5S8_9LACT|nr:MULTISPECIES: ParB/RepB/Spo0J family partition protein [Facklamia]EPH07583.1 ParB-like partition protein [Facklamia hominis ACS-120-V-Sch10]MDK7187397.1 ParB/RepB/Spo0J family partition protein [Facklamia hominis]OFL63811.1 chromosome partitioning protein ParB [Facklamia sp. HMSC062C11]